MNNEVYGTITLQVRIPVESTYPSLGLLQAAYRLNSEKVIVNLDQLLDYIRVSGVKLNDWNVDWDTYFSEDE
jgi:hypothetical protein